MTTEAVLACSGLRRSFGEHAAVVDVGFRIAAGETYGLLGPNGAGKTTTISMVVGLLEPDAGTITVAGEPMSPRSRAAKRHVGLVPQDLAIYPDLTARENLAFFGKLYGLPAAALDATVEEMLELIGLRDRADDRSEEFSGGMKRRLNIGIGLLHRPTLLVLDEPTVGVDPQSRNAILESVEGLASAGMAVLYTTHYMEEAERLCDRVGIIDEGRLLAEGTRGELVSMVGTSDLVALGLTGPTDGVVAAVVREPGVEAATATEDGLVVTVTGAAHLLPRLLTVVTERGATVSSVSVTESDLESVFLHLTGKALRDG